MEGYERVIPRDLFNEGDLKNLYGRLVIKLGETPDHDARFVEEQVPCFDVVQDVSGGLSIGNLTFLVRGDRYILTRPLNSRSKWSLWLTSYEDPDFEEIAVFDDAGELSADMLDLISTRDEGSSS